VELIVDGLGRAFAGGGGEPVQGAADFPVAAF
jgi:hypothetical protein